MADGGGVPGWVTDGWYANNPFAQQLAIRRYREPVTTPAERTAAKAFVPRQVTMYPCLGCGEFKFVTPRLCFWCARR